MYRKELIEKIAEKSGLTKKDSEAALNAFIDAVGGALAGGDKVTITGFGSFEVKERAERQGRNPATNEPMLIKASKSPKFKASKTLKEIVKG